ncbi:nuclear transport factor 2 family protein [Nocardiopsis quinghaiensis]|uniref:nuclear transport factor 2 family protein n=1 Tax=Nocardiopsis quinghaiensis TaxID=464995 RepID=UPI00167FEAF9|nr:nuclear transport factor 2 family protein [Nocardiopsis quinghaiensis]
MSRHNGTGNSVPGGSSVNAAAVDHVHLTYHYLNKRDFDGYASFLAENVRTTYPGLEPVRGTSATEEVQRSALGDDRTHVLRKVFGDESTVVALGVLDTGTSLEDFADVFRVDEHGMILEQQRFLGHQDHPR